MLNINATQALTHEEIRAKAPSIFTKQHEEATKKEQEKKDLMKKGLQQPEMPKKEEKK